MNSHGFLCHFNSHAIKTAHMEIDISSKLQIRRTRLFLDQRLQKHIPTNTNTNTNVSGNQLVMRSLKLI